LDALVVAGVAGSGGLWTSSSAGVPGDWLLAFWRDNHTRDFFGFVFRGVRLPPAKSLFDFVREAMPAI
jgi:hypothetical protein